MRLSWQSENAVESITFSRLCSASPCVMRSNFFASGFFDLEQAEQVPLYRKMMHAEHPSLYFIGLFQPLGCIWPLADHQAKLACAEIQGRYQRPRDMPAAIAHELAHPHYRWEAAPRHSTEVDYHMFRRELLAELASREAFGRGADPVEVANVIVFLASDLASYMTGEVVSVSSQHP